MYYIHDFTEFSDNFARTFSGIAVSCFEEQNYILLSFADPGCLFRILDRDFFPIRIPDSQTLKTRKGKNCCRTFWHSSSAFQISSSQYSTEAARHRNGSPYAGTGLVPASTLLFIPVSECPDSLAFQTAY
jgi:hypothetical protein